MLKHISRVLMLLGLSSPMFASDDAANAIGMVSAMMLFFFLLWLVVNIMFLLTQSKFAKSMQTSNEQKNTSAVWIWTQLIPLWAFIAIPVTLMKLNEQFKLYMVENDLNGNPSVKEYNNTWGWVWFGGSVLSLIIPFAGLIGLVGVIGFWIHIAGVKNSLVLAKQNKSQE